MLGQLFNIRNYFRFKVGLVLDAWLFSLKDEVLEPEQPIIFINTGFIFYFYQSSFLEKIEKLGSDDTLFYL